MTRATKPSGSDVYSCELLPHKSSDGRLIVILITLLRFSLGHDMLLVYFSPS